MPMKKSTSRRNIPVGIHIGYVKNVVDLNFAGRLEVWVPEFQTREDDPEGWILCNYCSPFAGATNWKDSTFGSEQQLVSFEGTQTAYGMWMIPPDINNEVVIMFPGADVTKAVWIGGLFKEYMNFDVPGVPASDATAQFKGTPVPGTNYNKHDKEKFTQPINPSRRPYHKTRFEGISSQGLIHDKIRGLNTSGAQRESPSKVFGILTPGPSIPGKRGARTGGSSFIMDDHEESEYIGFITKSGAQIKIDETNEMIYIINKPGSAWLQLDKDGNVDVFSAKSISMRAQEDFNLRADRDINIEAGQNIYMKAAKDTDASNSIVGEGAGIGGNIVIQALNEMHTTVKNNVFFTVTNGNLDIDVMAGNKTEHVKGNVDIRIDGKKQETIGGTLGIKSSNYQLDSSGSIDTEGSIISSGNMYAPDFKTPSHGLNDHQHIYISPQHSAGPASTSKDGGGGGSSSATGPDAIAALQAQVKAMNEKLNVLMEFADENKFERNSQSVKTTTNRFMTYEPCPEHINKGE